MAKIQYLGLLVVVVVSTVYPFVFLRQPDQLRLKRWYSTLGTALQSALYAWARVSSYPHIADLQHAVSLSHNTVEAFLVVTLGELTGAMFQGYLFDTVIAPLSGVKGSKASWTMTSASRRSPTLFSTLAHCSFVHVLAPYLVAFGVYCFGDSGDLWEGILGSTVAGLLMFIPIRIASPEVAPGWAYKFAYEVAVPSMRACATILMIYRLWCEHQAVSNGMGMPERNIDYRKYNLSAQEQRAQAAKPENQESPPRTRARARQRSRSQSRLRSENPLVPTPLRALRFQEGPPKMLTPPILRSKPEQAETEPAGRGRSRRSAPSRSPVRTTRAQARRSATTAASMDEADDHGDTHRRAHTLTTATIEHRLETTLTDNVYQTPRRSTRHSRTRVD